MRCPNCESDKIEFMNNDKLSSDGKCYTHECLKCGTMFTRDEIREGYKIGKQVLMEWLENNQLSDKSQKLRGKYLI